MEAELRAHIHFEDTPLDTMSVLGPVAVIDDLFVAAGHGPYGITLGPASGRIAADAVLGTAPVPQRFRVDRAAVAAATPLVAT